MSHLPLSIALTSVLGAAVEGDRTALLRVVTGTATTEDRRPLAPVVPLRRPGRPGPDRPQAA